MAKITEKKSSIKLVEEVPVANAPEAPANALPGKFSLRRNPFSHKLYERMGLNMSLRAIDIFIAVMVALLILAVILGIVL